jgi:hypothetical protein
VGGMMDNCLGCDATKELDEHFDAIFDFMDAHNIDYGDLPFIRMDIHSRLNH